MYNVIYADPPWNFRVYSDKGKGRSPKYDVMSFADLKKYPVQEKANEDCVLLMWVTDPMLEHGLKLINEWGFVYKTVGFYWVKPKFIGMGYWTRANPEQCLLATRGHPKRKSKSVRRLVESPRREHSRKPDEIYERIEQLLEGPYLELFARTKRKGWDQIGNQLGEYKSN